MFGIATIVWTVFAASLPYVLYQWFLSPLAAIPGPRLAALSDLWQLWYDMQGKGSAAIHRYHKKHGLSAVRVGPNEVSLPADPEVLKEVYGPTFLKSRHYDAFKIAGHAPIFGERSREGHAARVKRILPWMSKANVLQIGEPIIQEKVSKLCSRVDALIQEGPAAVDVLKSFRCFAVDSISAFTLPEGWDTLDEEELDSPMGVVIDVINKSAPTAFFSLYFHGWYDYVKQKLHSLLDSEGLAREGDAFGKLDAFADKSYEQSLKDSGSDVVTSFRQCTNADGEPLTKQQIKTEIEDLLFAGTDSSATTLSTIAFYVCRSKSIQERLLSELREVMPDRDSHATLKTLEKLPYLTAVIREGLRIAQPVPRRLPRVVPPGGWTYGRTGQYLPEGTIVGVAAYELHRSSPFTDPESFLPERWLGDNTSLVQMTAAFAAFGRGSRMCIGQNFAMAELYLATAYLFRRFAGEVITPKEIVYLDNFNASIKGGSVILRLRVVN